MVLTAVQVKVALVNMGLRNIPLVDVQNALAALDVDGIRKKQFARYRAEPWHPGELVNGVDPLKVTDKERVQACVDQEGPAACDREATCHKPKGGHGYFIYIDDRLVIFQWHDHRHAGLKPIPHAAIEETSKAHIADLAENEVNREIVETIAAELG